VDLADKVMESLPRNHFWPGNVRELEQAVRRILLTGRYTPETAAAMSDEDTLLLEKLRAGELTAAELLARYSAMLHRRLGTYAEVAKRTGLDPRTTRKYVEGARNG
jgi:DNA-binding NtrC family response regulator